MQYSVAICVFILKSLITHYFGFSELLCFIIGCSIDFILSKIIKSAGLPIWGSEAFSICSVTHVCL